MLFRFWQALLGHGARSDLSPLCAQKRTSASRTAMLTTPFVERNSLACGCAGGCLAGQGRSKVSQVTALIAQSATRAALEVGVGEFDFRVRPNGERMLGKVLFC